MTVSFEAARWPPVRPRLDYVGVVPCSVYFSRRGSLGQGRSLRTINRDDTVDWPNQAAARGCLEGLKVA
jgi:hypothetical protein